MHNKYACSYMSCQYPFKFMPRNPVGKRAPRYSVHIEGGLNASRASLPNAEFKKISWTICTTLRNTLQAFCTKWLCALRPMRSKKISLTAQGPISSWPEGFSTGGQDTLQISKRKHVGEQTVLHEPERMVKSSEGSLQIPNFDKDFNPKVLTSTGTICLWPMRRFKSQGNCLTRIQ